MSLLIKSVVVCVALVISGCSVGDPVADVDRRVKRGDGYAANKQFREAIIEYRNALQIAPTAGEARLKVGQAYEALGDLDDALREYVRAADALPANRDVQLKAGSFLLAARMFNEAESRARKVLAADPDNPRRVVVANAQEWKKQPDEALRRMRPRSRSIRRARTAYQSRRAAAREGGKAGPKPYSAPGPGDDMADAQVALEVLLGGGRRMRPNALAHHVELESTNSTLMKRWPRAPSIESPPGGTICKAIAAQLRVMN